MDSPSDSGPLARYKHLGRPAVGPLTDEGLIKLYGGLIYKTVERLGFCNKYHDHYHNGLEFEDAVQVGRIALLIAYRLWDVEQCEDFGAFAYSCIRREILNEVRRCQWIPNEREHGRPHIMHTGYVAVWEAGDDYREGVPDDPTYEAAAWAEELTYAEQAVGEMPLAHRQIFQGVMCRDDAESTQKDGRAYYGNIAQGFSASRVSQIRKVVRGKIKRALH